MFWIIVALAAYLGFAAVAVIDKYLLAGPIKSPGLYAALIGLLSLLAYLFLPLAFYLPPKELLLLDFVAGATFVLALLFYFTALKHGQASRVVPLSSALVPLFTLIFAHQLTADRLTLAQGLGFLLLVAGGVLISLERNLKTRKKIIAKVIWATIIASALFGLHFTLMKQVFNTQEFISGLIWSSSGKLVVGLIILIYLMASGKFKLRAQRPRKKKSLGLFLLGRTLGGLSGISQNYAIALASVSLVTAMQGFQYAFLFLLIYLVGKKVRRLREDFSKKILIQKIVAAAMLSIGLALVYIPKTENKKYELGITFSHSFATHGLHINWQQAYDDIINELPIKWLRLPVYWSEVQPKADEWNLDIIEYQLKKASEKDIKIILSVGRKLPRWPECHIPEWAKNLSTEQHRNALLYYVGEIVKLYDSHPNVVAWQVENEPLFPFGFCPEPDEELLRSEVALVKLLSKKPVIVSDSGELSTWLPEAKIGDILGTTMYRNVFHEKWGLVYYPLPPTFFQLKEVVAKTFSGRWDLPIINVELQAEPWGRRPLNELPLEEQLKLMNARQLKNNVAYAKKAGFSPILLWGAEWWWWMKNTHNNPSLWDTAKEIFNSQ